jgi:hypothetical protein
MGQTLYSQLNTVKLREISRKMQLADTHADYRWILLDAVDEGALTSLQHEQILEMSRVLHHAQYPGSQDIRTWNYCHKISLDMFIAAVSFGANSVIISSETF